MATVDVDDEITRVNLSDSTYESDSNFNGDDSFDYNASDGTAFADEDASVNITVAAENDAPTVFNISKTAQEDTALTFAASDFDAGFADDDEDTLQTIQITSLPTSGVLRLDGEAVAVNDEIARADISRLTYTPSLNYHSTDSFGWNGSDGTVCAETSSLVNITVEEVNDDPILDEIPDINEDEGVAINFFAHGEDVDSGTVLVYSLINAPTGATIDSATGEFTWTPTEAQAPGSYTFQIKVSDGEGGEDYQDVTINVAEINAAPVLPFMGARTLLFGSTTTYNFAASDADLPKNDLEYSLIGAPAGASIDPNTGVFSWTPTAAQSNNAFYSFNVRVTDNGSPSLWDEETASFTVQRPNVNTAPVLPFVGARTLYLGRTNTLNFAATDADSPADTLTYSLIGAPSGASIDPTTGIFTWTPTAAQANPASNFYSFKIKVSDNGFPAKSDEETASFTVQYPTGITVNTTGPSLKADGKSQSVSFTYTVRNNTGVAQSNLKVQGDVFWPTALQSVTLTSSSGTTAPSEYSDGEQQTHRVDGSFPAGVYQQNLECEADGCGADQHSS